MRKRVFTDKERRARSLLKNYIKKDEEYNRGKGDLTYKWIAENILTKPCTHCGETDWHKIGCNRIDNSKPHTMDNVEPCCKKCNDKLASLEKKLIFGKPIDQIDIITGEIVASYISERDASRKTGWSKSNISAAANGGRIIKGKWKNIHQSHNFIWKYKA